MNALWRAALITLLLGSALFYPLQFTLVPKSGDFGFSTDYLVANAPSITRRVMDVEPGSPAWRAGLRVGDVLPLRDVDRISRVALKFALPGDQARYDAQRGLQTYQAQLVAQQAAPLALGLPDWIRNFVIYCLLVFGLLVVLRAWNTEHGPVIATILTGLVVDASADRIPWVPETANLVGALLFGNNAWIDAMATAVSMLLPVVLAGRLIGTQSAAFRFALSGVTIYAAFVVVYSPIGLFLQHDGMAGAFAEFANDWLLNTLPFFAGAIALLVAYRVAARESKQRLRWIFWGFFPYLFGVGLINVIADVPFTAQWYFSRALIPQIAASAFRGMELALPIALFYGVLLRRVIDIGFVFNRVAVYGTFSILIVSIFVLIEYGLSHFLVETGRVGSLLIQLGIALAIGLSARYLHRAVDRLVDHVLFAKRHADEAALRRFAHEAEAFVSTGALLDRAVDVLREHSEVRGLAIYLTGDAGVKSVRSVGSEYPAEVDLDDPLLVKLRRWNEPVDTHEVNTAFPDGMVFPMIARTKLVGALACATKRDYSAFDPTERESLLEVARGVGVALDALSSERAESIGALRESIADAVASLGKKIDSLPEKIVQESRFRTTG